MRTIQIDGRIYRQDSEGRWTMDIPEVAIINEPVFEEDVIDFLLRNGHRDIAQQLDPMRSMRQQ